MTDSELPVYRCAAPLDPSMFQQIQLSKSWGPLKIEVSLDIAQLQASLSVYLYNTRVGGCTLNPAHPTCSVGGDVGVASAKVQLTLDVAATDLTYDIQLCVFGSCRRMTGTLYSWNASAA